MKNIYTLALTFFFCSGSVLADTLFVDANLTTGADDGSSWQDAFQGVLGLQAALSAAESGDQVFVAQGTYRPALDRPRSASFRLVDGVEVYGSFLGGETSPDERLPFPANPSILSGDLAGNDAGPGSGTAFENSYHVVRATNVGPATLLDGFIVEAGYAAGNSDIDTRGGGLYFGNAGRATISNCWVRGNFAIRGGGVGIGGNAGNAGPRLFDCTIEGNTAPTAGAVFFQPGCTARIDRCRILFNSGTNTGAVLTESDTAGYIRNTVLYGNVVSGAGGTLQVWRNNPSLRLRNLTVVGNRAPAHFSAGLDVQGNLDAMQISNCVFWGNEGQDGSRSQNQVGGETSLTYCIVEGGYPGEGNLDLDPGFFDEASGDLRLRPDSPAIDAGNNLAVAPEVTLDINGGARFADEPTVMDTGNGAGAIVDLGAYERQPAPGQVFCSSDGTAAACPCAEGSELTGCANSEGSGVRLDAGGSASVAADDLTFVALGVPSQQPALLFWGTETIAAGSGIAFGDGLRCIGGDVVRLGVRIGDGVDYVEWAPENGGWLSGTTVYFQAWYRDPQSPCGGAFNLSNALAVVLED